MQSEWKAPFYMRCWLFVLAGLLMFLSVAQLLRAEDSVSAVYVKALEKGDENSLNSAGQLADIRVHSAEELLEILSRVETLHLEGGIESGAAKPIVFLLHGEEAKTLFKDNYNQYRPVVDLAAKLTAFGVADIKVCERWMDGAELDKNNLQPFVTTVPYAPKEKKRLIKERGYIYF